MVTGQSYRERASNIKEAMSNLIKHPKFKVWHIKKIHEVRTGKTIEQKVESMLKPENIKVECHDDTGRWIACDASNAVKNSD
jgi:hypothetical protein